MALKYKGMLTCRVKKKTLDMLTVMARLTGAHSASGFLRGMLEDMCSGDPKQLTAFVSRMYQAADTIDRKTDAAIQTTFADLEKGAKKLK